MDLNVPSLLQGLWAKSKPYQPEAKPKPFDIGSRRLSHHHDEPAYAGDRWLPPSERLRRRGINPSKPTAVGMPQADLDKALASHRQFFKEWEQQMAPSAPSTARAVAPVIRPAAQPVPTTRYNVPALGTRKWTSGAVSGIQARREAQRRHWQQVAAARRARRLQKEGSFTVDEKQLAFEAGIEVFCKQASPEGWGQLVSLIKGAMVPAAAPKTSYGSQMETPASPIARAKELAGYAAAPFSRGTQSAVAVEQKKGTPLGGAIRGLSEGPRDATAVAKSVASGVGYPTGQAAQGAMAVEAKKGTPLGMAAEIYGFAPQYRGTSQHGAAMEPMSWLQRLLARR